MIRYYLLAILFLMTLISLYYLCNIDIDFVFLVISSKGWVASPNLSTFLDYCYDLIIVWVKFIIISSLFIGLKICLMYFLIKFLTYGMKDPQLYYAQLGWGMLFLELLFPTLGQLLFAIYYGILFAEFFGGD